MRLFVYEYASGGGCREGAVPARILCEGYGMLRALISDLSAEGHGVTSLLDSRLEPYTPLLAAEGVRTAATIPERERLFRSLAAEADAFYIIAPEGVLAGLLLDGEAAGGITINCSASTAKRLSDKVWVMRALRGAGISTPETIVLDLKEDLGRIKRLAADLEFPLIFKPSEGTGCSGLSVVPRVDAVAAAVEKLRRGSAAQSGVFLIQRLVVGVDLSLSLLSDGARTVPLTLNRQWVELSDPRSDSAYLGGVVPFDTPEREELFRVGKGVVEAVGGFRGYLGVDLVMAGDEVVVVDLNPRLTTSYIGLRRVINLNPAGAMLNAVFEGRLPAAVKTSGYAVFSKLRISSVTPKRVLERISQLEEVVSPPLPPASDTELYAIGLTCAPTLGEAEGALSRLKGRIESMVAET